MKDRSVVVTFKIPEGVHPEVARECEECWGKDRPWTPVRPLREGTDNPSGSPCGGAMGSFDKPCSKPVTHVQYTSAFGDPLWFCDEHAKIQIAADKNIYDSKPVFHGREHTPEEKREIEKILAKYGKKKKKKPEPVVPDLME